LFRCLFDDRDTRDRGRRDEQRPLHDLRERKGAERRRKRGCGAGERGTDDSDEDRTPTPAPVRERSDEQRRQRAEPRDRQQRRDALVGRVIRVANDTTAIAAAAVASSVDCVWSNPTVGNPSTGFGGAGSGP
jgi:hypothetical protein